MNGKKVVVLVVEGNTDQIVFEKFIRKIVKKYAFYVKVINGDILTNKRNSDNIGAEIIQDVTNLLYKEIKLNHDDIAFIGHIIDIDGVFIPRKRFVINNDNSYTFGGRNYVYDLKNKQVIVKDELSKEKLLNSWDVKKDNIKDLFNEIRYIPQDIPYKIYYNSIDLEHVICERIVKDKDKEKEASKFISSLKNKFYLFEDFFNSKTPTLDYEHSWEDIFGSREWQIAKSNIRFLIEDIREIENNTFDNQTNWE